MHRKLTLDRQTIKLLASRELERAKGGASGEPCDVTLAHSKCDFGCTGGPSCVAQ
jgi:hypothetical protein